ncbi:MAG TPA: Trm112 family protein [bacterium]|nr:Trm112 family protein [bacterium]
MERKHVISQELLNILICPACGSALREKENALECTACKNRYPIENGIPVLLVDRAEKPKTK